MAQSNHSVKIDVTADATEAKRRLQEIEALLNKLSRGANIGLGAGGGGAGGGTGGPGGTGGSGGGGGAGGGSGVSADQQARMDENKRQHDRRLDLYHKMLELEREKTTNAAKLEADKDYYAQKADIRAQDLQNSKAALDKATADHEDALARQRELDREARAETRRLDRQKEQTQRQAARKAEQEERRRLRALEREDIKARQASERRRYALFTGTAKLARGTALTGMGIAGAGDTTQAISAMGRGLGSLPGVGPILGASINMLATGLQTRLGLQQGFAGVQPAAVAARRLSPGTGGIQEQLGRARTLALGLGVGPSQFFQRQAAIAGGAGRNLLPNELIDYIEQSFKEQFLGVDPNSLSSFVRQATLGRESTRRQEVLGQLGRIESFRQQQGLLPAELTMLRQAGLGFRQQGLAQGFDIQESSLFGLTQGIMGSATSGAGQSLTGAMGLAQRERQLGVGAFQSFAGQFADLPNTLLLAQAAQRGGGIRDILSTLSDLGATPGKSAAALRSARGRFGIPREILQAGISAQLGLGFEAGGDVLRAESQEIGAAQGFLPEMKGIGTDRELGLAAAFAEGQVSRLEAGARFGDAQQLRELLNANVSMQTNLASMNVKQLPRLIESVQDLQGEVTPIIQGMNSKIVELVGIVRELFGR